MYMFCRDSKLLGMEKMRRHFALDPMGKCAERLLLQSAATDYTHIYTVNSIQTGKCLGQNQRRKLFECKVIKGHSILYRQPMEIKV